MLAIAVVNLTACEKADHLYCNLPARFTMENIYQAPALYTACNSMGQFCTITASSGNFEFKSITKTDRLPITGGYVYDGFYLGLSGLIVGLPDRTEMLKDQIEVVCFDLACSYCYHEFGITKPLKLQENGKAQCTSCKSLYDLNDMGRGSEGKSLYRYHVRLIGNTLVIAN